MARINLLPWREELRKQKKKDFLLSIGAAVVVTLVILVFVHLHIDGMQAYQEQRNRILDDEIKRIDQKLGEIKNIEDSKKKLLAKISSIQDLQESRPEAVHLLDEIPRTTPDGVYLTKITQIGQDLSFEGKSQSNARVSAFMRQIDASKWLHSSSLDEIKAEDKTSAQSTFKLKAVLGKQAADTAKAPAAK